ncbi:MAG TPA: type I secretion C-terminal target domain-containing protein [Candidatus Defluviicoccus seviourii]|nr:type I secretion C-terminal target domain-containing protein [Candidatus Defluviicoccus seviourii]
MGGGDKDTLYGNEGADTFRYLNYTESKPSYRNGLVDVIKDFSVAQGDKIDLRAIDASSKVAGDQAFGFASGPGQGVVWTERVGVDLFVKADIANSYVGENFVIELDNFSGTLSASSYLL